MYGQEMELPVFKIYIREKIAIKDLLANASLILGKAYMNNVIEIEGNLEELIYDMYSQSESFLRSARFINWFPKESHSKKRSKEDIRRHYDLENNFYRK